VKKEENVKTMIKSDKAKILAKDDEVKAEGKTAQKFEFSKATKINREIETKAFVTLPHLPAIISKIPVFTFFSFISSFNISTLILNSRIADPLDPRSQTLIIGDLRSCKQRPFSQQTASSQADLIVQSFATADSIRPFTIPGNRQEAHYRKQITGPLWYLTTYSQAKPGTLKPSFIPIHLYSTT
jgi:hypothetical protein